MNDEIFPTLAGIKWDQKKTPIFSTRIQRAVSGGEARAGNYVYPLYKYDLSYELLRDNIVNNELKTLMGFYLSRQGALESFLYKDPSDYIITSQVLGTGDGATAVFPFYRTYGGFIDPVTDVMVPSSPTPILNVYLGVSPPVLQTSGYTVTYLGGVAKITFTSPYPSNGQVVSADFSYYKRVRFMEYGEGDEAFSNFMYQLWELKKISFITAR